MGELIHLYKEARKSCFKTDAYPMTNGWASVSHQMVFRFVSDAYPILVVYFSGNEIRVYLYEMGIQDLIVTPVYLLLFTLIAYLIRPKLTNKFTKKYFLPALWVRFGGAIFLGLIYQFYYSGGDTFNFYQQASIVFEAFMDDPVIGFKLIFDPNDPELFNYASRIYWFRSPTEYIVIRIIAFLSLFTINAYTAIALFFAFFGFMGSWLMFHAAEERFPMARKWLVYGILFVPSCIFWGSGILKDTITLGALGLAFWSCNEIITKRRFTLVIALVLLGSCWLIYSIKVYIILCFIPSIFIWWYLQNIRSIRNTAIKVLLIPVFLVAFGVGGYMMLKSVANSSEKYSLDSIAKMAYVTSYDIRFYSGKEAGSGYDLGIQDGTWQSMIGLAPAAVNVSLFRPYLWEVRNPLMLLSSLESLMLFILTLGLIPRLFKKSNRKLLKEPVIVMFLIFSIVFAFAVGVSTYNFGSLSRYKIPLLPFYISAIILLYKVKVKDNIHTPINKN